MQKIYVLKNPINNTYFYVGITSGTLKKRLNGHMNSTDKNEEKTKLICEIVKSGYRPEIILLETITDNSIPIKERELFWINTFFKEKHPLTNKSLNGAGRNLPIDPKVPLTFYFPEKIINHYGGKEELKKRIYKIIELQLQS